MKVLAVFGSPRQGGNSEILLEKFLAGVAAGAIAHQVEKVFLNQMRFLPCQECGGCDATGLCVLKDDLQAFYQKLDQAQAVVLAAPIFFGSLPAQVKAMIDRYQCHWVGKYRLQKKSASAEKKGFLLLVEASAKESFFKNAESIVKNFFAVEEIRFAGRVYCPGVDGKGKIMQHPQCLSQAFELGKTIGDEQ